MYTKKEWFTHAARVALKIKAAMHFVFFGGSSTGALDEIRHD